MRPNYNSLFVRIYALMACLGIGLGVAIVVGGTERFSGPSFRGPHNLVDWTGMPAYAVWGVVFLAYGLSLVFSLGRRAAIHVLRVGIALYFFFVLSFATSVAVDPKASITGCVAYTITAVVHLYLSDHLHHRGWEGC